MKQLLKQLVQDFWITLGIIMLSAMVGTGLTLGVLSTICVLKLAGL